MVVVLYNFDVYFVEFVLVDDYNHQSKHVKIEFDEEITMVLVMLVIDDVLQQMLMQLLDEVLMDLLDDDFLLSKFIFIKKEKSNKKKFTSITIGSEKSYLRVLVDIIGPSPAPSRILYESNRNLPAFSANIRSRSI
jgi:hypothetical protein